MPNQADSLPWHMEDALAALAKESARKAAKRKKKAKKIPAPSVRPSGSGIPEECECVTRRGR